MAKSSPSIWHLSQIDGEDFFKFCGLLSKNKLYLELYTIYICAKLQCSNLSKIQRQDYLTLVGYHIWPKDCETGDQILSLFFRSLPNRFPKFKFTGYVIHQTMCVVVTLVLEPEKVGNNHIKKILTQDLCQLHNLFHPFVHLCSIVLWYLHTARQKMKCSDKNLKIVYQMQMRR